MAPEHADALDAKFTRALIRIKAKQLARRREFWRARLEDVESDLLAYLVQHIENFDPARSQLNTYISRVLDTAVAMLLRDSRRAKRASGHNVRSIESLRENLTENPVTGASSVSEDDARRRLGLSAESFVEALILRESVREIVAGLDRDLSTVCLLVFNGGSIASIARELRVSRRQVRGMLARIRQRFVDGGFGEI